MADNETTRTKGKLLGYHFEKKGAKLENPENNINYLGVKAGEMNFSAEIANLRDSNFVEEVKHLNALHIIKCWNTHAKLMTFLTEIVTNDQPWYKAEKSITAKAKRLLKEGLDD